VLVDGHCVISGTIESRLTERLEEITGVQIRYLS
jgi:hypothetical protein